MSRSMLCSRALLLAIYAGTALIAASISHAQAPHGDTGNGDTGKRLREPVFRVSNKLDSTKPRQNAQPVAPPKQPAPPASNSLATRPNSPATRPNPAVAAAVAAKRPEHPLDPAIAFARERLGLLRANVRDYTCTLVKRERVNGTVTDYEYMFTKVRNRKVVNGRTAVPFSVYMYFLKPTNIKGREVTFVEGKNNGKMMAHEGGAAGAWLPSVWLRPEGPLAMRGNLYPITDVGIENLVVKLIERGVREKQYGDCQVTFHKNAKVNGRVCTLLQIMHPVKRDEFEFYLAQIFVDDEYNVPIRYAAYSWPTKPGGRPEVLEEYTYLNLKLNVGLTDADFDHKSRDYNFTRH